MESVINSGDGKGRWFAEAGKLRLALSSVCFNYCIHAFFSIPLDMRLLLRSIVEWTPYSRGLS